MNLIGHENTKRQLNVSLKSAQTRNMALPHMLFSGSPGCGKTTMASEIAKLIGVDFIVASPESIKDATSVLKLLENLNHNNYDDKGNRTGAISPSIVFFDEIHNLPLKGQETLGIAMENFRLETGKPNKYYWLPYFTIIGATTLSGNLSKPFLNRFKMNFLFTPYNIKESIDIIRMHCKRLSILITGKAVEDIAIRGRGIPRTMVGYIERMRDAMLAKDSMIVASAITNEVFAELGIDKKGFTQIEIKILKALYNNDIPVGLENLAIITNESARTIKETIEPYLIQNGLLLRSGSGRIITREGKIYLEDQGYVGNTSGKQAISAHYVRK